MTALADFDARAVLCRQLAELEPHNRGLWLAEADRWHRLAALQATASGEARLELKPVPAGKNFRRPGGIWPAWLSRPSRQVSAPDARPEDRPAIPD